MDTIYELTRKIVIAEGGSPKPLDLRSKLLKRLVVAKGGSTTIFDNETTLARKLARSLGYPAQTGTYLQTLRAITPGASADDKEWDLLNKILLGGFATYVPRPPNAPKSLVAAALASDVISLIWTDRSADELGFEIWRSLDGVTFTQVGASDHDQNNYEDTGLTPGTLYYYRVKSFNAVGSSHFSNVASATTNAAPGGGDGFDYAPQTQVVDWYSEGDWGGTFHEAVSHAAFLATDKTLVKTFEAWNTDNRLTSLTGLQAMVNLETLSLLDQSLTELDISNLANLLDLQMSGDVTIQSIDASGCAELQQLMVYGSTSLQDIDVTGCDALRKVQTAFAPLNQATVDAILLKIDGNWDSAPAPGIVITMNAAACAAPSAAGSAAAASLISKGWTVQVNPTPPTNLIEMGEDGVSTVDLAWTDNSVGESGFRIYGRDVTAAESFSLQVTTGENAGVVTGHEHNGTGFIVGHNYEYYVVAFGVNGESAHSNQISIPYGA